MPTEGNGHVPAEDIEALRKALDEAVSAFDREAVDALAKRVGAYVEANLAEHPAAFCASLGQSLERFDDARTVALCAALVAHLRGREAPYPSEHAVGMLKRLRRKRRFEEILRVAGALIQHGCDGGEVRRAYAQALIDAGYPEAGIDTLRWLERRFRERGDAHGLREVRGLLGRAWKQIYCTGAGHGARRREALERAERCYAEEFRRDDGSLWHGINAVALQQRARRDELADYVPSTGTITGRDILALAGVPEAAAGTNGTAADGRGARDPADIDEWTRATIAEAYVAEGDFGEALRWIARYVENGEDDASPVDAFEIASTLRQFEEVWQLDPEDPPQARVLEVLRSALLGREGGSVSLADARTERQAVDTLLEDRAFEQILGRERFRNLGWYRTGLERARLVCKFVDRHGEGFGSGFLVPAEDLGLAHDARWVVLTNAHVVSDSAEEQGASPAARSPDAAWIRFEGSDEPERRYAIARVLASSPRHELDFAVLALEEEGDFPEPSPIARRLPLAGREQRIYVIGHPRGGGLSFSLNDNLLLDHEAPKVHYRSPTEGGSSGSPLFNQVWELIGLHHAGGMEMPRLNGQAGRYPANEGFWIQSIRSAIAASAAC